MKHLFIINSEADGVKGKARNISQRITLFFQQYPDISYYIHITRWSRDALAFAHRYATDEYLTEADGLVRIHILGGMGTVYEVINGIVGLPGVQIAIYPYSNTVGFLKYFGETQLTMFSSFYHQVFSQTIPLDLMKCGNNFAFMNSHTGMDTNKKNIFKAWQGKNLHQRYQVTIDGKQLEQECIAIIITNIPITDGNRTADANVRPDDGVLDLYLIKRIPHLNRFWQLLQYLFFHYKSYPEYIIHETGYQIGITSEEILQCRLDGEIYYETNMEYRLLSHAIDFVCPPRDGGLSL